MFKKKITMGVMATILVGSFIIGYNNYKIANAKNTIAVKNVNLEISADGQFDSNIGEVTEQPIYNEKGEKIGKRLFVLSSKDVLNEESLKEFYNSLLSQRIMQEQIIISTGNNEGIEISLKDKKVWYCSIADNFEVLRIKKIYDL